MRIFNRVVSALLFALAGAGAWIAVAGLQAQAASGGLCVVGSHSLSDGRFMSGSIEVMKVCDDANGAAIYVSYGSTGKAMVAVPGGCAR